MAGTVALIILIGAAFIQDVREAKIANRITIPGILVGAAVSMVTDGEGWLSGLADSLVGLLAGVLVMLLLYAFGAVGAGDVKLFGAIGAISGLTFVVYGMVNAVLCAGVIGLFLLLWKRELRHRLKFVFALLFRIWIFREWQPAQSVQKKEMLRFPFMYAVVPAIGLTWWTLGFV